MKKLILTVILIGGLFMGNADALTIKKVEFKSCGTKLAGNLYLPEGYSGGERLPAVIVTGAWTTVKEQMPTNYAEKLAAKGYAALVFDFRGWGESDGGFRYLEDPSRKTEDIIEAAAYLASRPEIDPSKIAGVGICASSGYMIGAYTQTYVLKTIAVVAPWLHNREIVNQVYSGEENVNKFNTASWKGWLTYDAITFALKVSGEILFVESESMALPMGSKEFKEIAGDNVKSVNLKGVSQFDFYDRPEPVTKSVDNIHSFLNRKFQEN